MSSVAAGAALLALGSLLAALARGRWPGRLFITGLALAGGLWLPPCVSVLAGRGTLAQTLHLGPPLGEVRLVLDPLAAFFLLLVALLSLAGAVFGSGYLRATAERGRPLSSHYFFLGLFVAGMVLTTIVQNALAFLVAWEAMSVASLFLVLFDHEKEETVGAGLTYFVAMHVGVALLVAAFAVLYLETGSLDFGAFAAVLSRRSALSGALFLLLFAGFGLKAGFIPLHTWLPRAHPAAPSHVSGMMSGLMIKIGIYGILRVVSLMGPPPAWVSGLVLGMGLFSAVAGVMLSVSQRELKRLLAYSSVENVGIIGTGIGTGMLGMTFAIPAMAFWGFAGALLHVLNHSLFKALLFYGAGAVSQQTHTLDLERLGGLARRLPRTSACFLTGSLAISGLPPLNGFVSEFFIYIGLMQAVLARQIQVSLVAVLAMGLLAAVGAMALIGFSKAFTIAFLGGPRSAEAEGAQRDPAPAMLLPLGVLAASCLLIGLLPQLALQAVRQPAQLLAAPLPPAVPEAGISLLGQLANGLWLLAGLLAAGAWLRHRQLRRHPPPRFKTWDCGYSGGGSRLQYSASSYAAPFVSLARPLLSIEEKRQLPEGLFPEKAVFTSHSHDAFERAVIAPAARGITALLDLFSWVQRGSTQQYILYGLLFLVAAVVCGLAVGG